MTSEEFVSFLPSPEDFMSEEYEACSYASTSAIPDDGTPITKSVSVCRRQRVPKRAASLTRGKSVEVLPRVSEEEEPSTCNATEDDAEDADEPRSGSAWSSDEDERPVLTRSSSFTKGLLKRLRKHRPRPLGIIAGRSSIVDDWVISPAAVLDESSDDEVVISFPQPPRTPSTPKKPVLKLELPKDVISQHGAQSPTPSNASSASPVSTAPNTPGGSDNERELVSPVDSILSSRNKPLPPPPAIHPYDRRVPTADQDDLWERRINEIFSLLTGDDALADTSDNDESSVQRFPTGPAVRTVEPLSPISSSSIASSRRRRSYVSTAPKRPPPPVPESVTSDSPLSVFSPTESEFMFPLPELSPRPRPALPRSPIPADIPVDVRASMATTVSDSSYSEGSFFDAYQALQTADLRSRFSTSTFASSRFTGVATSPTDSLYIRKRKSSKSSANTRAAREALRKRNARVEAPMSPTTPSTIATPMSF